ncbi:MAG: hypothetical protein LBL87_03885 [Ruminococcus sp.]|jgi:Zn-dependent protease|nr:hypothetical protein [Ruminococcus sp.]
MQCNSCGGQNPDNAIYCNNCGIKLIGNSSVKQIISFGAMIISAVLLACFFIVPDGLTSVIFLLASLATAIVGMLVGANSLRETGTKRIFARAGMIASIVIVCFIGAFMAIFLIGFNLIPTV